MFTDLWMLNSPCIPGIKSIYLYTYTYILKSIWSRVSFKASVFLLIFCLDTLFINVSGDFGSLLLFNYCQFLPLCQLIVALHIRWAYIGCINIYDGYILFFNQPLYHYVIPFFVFCVSLYFPEVSIATPTLLCSIFMEYLFHHFLSGCVFKSEVSFL